MKGYFSLVEQQANINEDILAIMHVVHRIRIKIIVLVPTFHFIRVRKKFY